MEEFLWMRCRRCVTWPTPRSGRCPRPPDLSKSPLPFAGGECAARTKHLGSLHWQATSTLPARSSKCLCHQTSSVKHAPCSEDGTVCRLCSEEMDLDKQTQVLPYALTSLDRIVLKKTQFVEAPNPLTQRTATLIILRQAEGFMKRLGIGI